MAVSFPSLVTASAIAPFKYCYIFYGASWLENTAWRQHQKQEHHSLPIVLLLLFSCSVVSDSLWPHELQHTRLSCLPLSPRVCSDSSWWCDPTTLSSATYFSFCLQPFSASGSFLMNWVFSNESALCIRWPEDWSFSFSMENEGKFLVVWTLFKHCLSLRLEWKLTFSSTGAIAEFSKFAGTLSTEVLQHHLLGCEIAQLEFHHLH